MIWLLTCTNGFTIVSSDEGAPIESPGLVDSSTEPCEDAVDGAVFSFVFGVGRAMDIWVEDDDFIDWHLAGQPGWPVFHELVDGEGCDPDYDWHPSPTALEWVQDYGACSDEVPVASAPPEAPWCVTTFEVIDVEDRR